MLNKRHNLSRYAIETNENATIEYNVFLKSNPLKMHGNCDGILHDGLGHCYILEFKNRAMGNICQDDGIRYDLQRNDW